MATSPRVGFIGAGNMATALVRGLVGAAGGDGSRLAVTDIDASRCAALAKDHGVHVCADAKALAEWAAVIVLAVKPQAIADVLREAAPALDARHLVISIAAGVTTAKLAASLGPDVRLVRAMPNTPALVGSGATAICAGPRASEADLSTSRSLFEAVGRVVTVAEGAMNAVTGLSGSGPAYVFIAIEALADAGVREGLPRDVALSLAAQTVAGAAQLVLETGAHPGELKDKVTSPGGTTIAGVAALEREGLRHALLSAVQAATKRAAELGD